MFSQIEKLIQEWHVIRAAPRSFILATVIIFAIIWAVFEWRYSSGAGTQHARVTGSGNITMQAAPGGTNTLNTGPKYMSVDSETINDLRKLIPPGSKVEVAKAIQDAPTAQIANQLHALLKQHGYIVGPGVADSLGAPYFKGVSISKSNNQYWLTVGDTRLN